DDPEERRIRPTLLFTARLQPLKGPDLALEVLARLDPALGARLVLAGGVSQDFAEYLDQLRGLARELGIEDRVDFVGSLGRDELAESMRCAGALLLTSWSETFGLVALEAQASGRADRKSTRLNSSHVSISYAVFCLKKKKYKQNIE